ncbi:MAG: aspartate-semialdehyde dehydrogenase [Crocinitomicaceae bacterium]|nr:aspartate-semialdehyde dehydrogenase [Crocinitomicaceae bacterium]
MKLALIGATGLVGRTMLEVMEELALPVDELLPAASGQSVGKEVEFQGRKWTIQSVEDVLAARPQVALFSAGGDVSKRWAPEFAKAGITVVDNSSAWRMDSNCPLVVPEVNGDAIGSADRIIANPNCTTMQLVMVLKPLHEAYRIQRGVVSTYQSITGTGKAAIVQLESERAGASVEAPVYPHPIDLNCLPHCDVFGDNGYTREEMKVWNETKKILGDEEVHMSCTAVRVPVMGGHSESVYLEFERPFELQHVRQKLADFPGVVVVDEPAQNQYPMPRTAEGKNDVFVGRIRRDLANERGLHLWIVADNLRKGAATNTVQIAQYLHEQGRWA